MLVGIPRVVGRHPVVAVGSLDRVVGSLGHQEGMLVGILELRKVVVVGNPEVAAVN